MKFVIELSLNIRMSMLFLIFLSVLILKGACQTSSECTNNYQCKNCANATYGCIDCLGGQGLSMEMYPSVKYICRDCGTYCTNCVNRTKCTECNHGYGPLGSTNCSACISPNCLACPLEVQTCVRCSSGHAFYSSNSNICGACSEHCTLYGCDKRFAGNCDQCDPGFGYIGTTFLCGPCSPNCAAGCNRTGSGTCDQCDSGYGIAPNGSCAPCSSNCVAGCNQTGAGKCDKCDLGFGLTSTKSCAPCSSNCAAGCNLTGAGSCDKCNPGYEPASGGSCGLITTTPIATTTRTTTTAAATSTSTTTTAAVQSSSENPSIGTSGLSSSQITGEKDTTANPISGVTSISRNPISGGNNFTGATGYTTASGGDRFNSDTAILATLLSLIIGGIIVSIFVIGFWCSRFSAAAAIKTTILQETLLLKPEMRTAIAPDNYRWTKVQFRRT